MGGTVADGLAFVGHGLYPRVMVVAAALVIAIGITVGLTTAAQVANEASSTSKQNAQEASSLWQAAVTTHIANAASLAQTLGAFASGLANSTRNTTLSIPERIEKLNDVAFQRLAARLFTEVKGILSLQVQSHGILSQMYPYDAGIENKDIIHDGNFSGSVIKARNTGKTVVAGPLYLFQGDWGIVVRYPVYIHDNRTAEHFWGLGNVVAFIGDLMRNISIDALHRRDRMDWVLWVDQNTSALSNTTEPTVRLLASPNVEASADVEDRVKRSRYRWVLPIQDPNRVTYFALEPIGGLISEEIPVRQVIGIVVGTVLFAVLCSILIAAAGLGGFLHRHRRAPTLPTDLVWSPADVLAVSLLSPRDEALMLSPPDSPTGNMLESPTDSQSPINTPDATAAHSPPPRTFRAATAVVAPAPSKHKVPSTPVAPIHVVAVSLAAPRALIEACPAEAAEAAEAFQRLVWQLAEKHAGYYNISLGDDTATVVFGCPLAAWRFAHDAHRTIRIHIHVPPLTARRGQVEAAPNGFVSADPKAAPQPTLVPIDLCTACHAAGSGRGGLHRSFDVRRDRYVFAGPPLMAVAETADLALGTELAWTPAFAASLIAGGHTSTLPIHGLRIVRTGRAGPSSDSDEALRTADDGPRVRLTAYRVRTSVDASNSSSGAPATQLAFRSGRNRPRRSSGSDTVSLASFGPNDADHLEEGTASTMLLSNPYLVRLMREASVAVGAAPQDLHAGPPPRLHAARRTRRGDYDEADGPVTLLPIASPAMAALPPDVTVITRKAALLIIRVERQPHTSYGAYADAAQRLVARLSVLAPQHRGVLASAHDDTIVLSFNLVVPTASPVARAIGLLEALRHCLPGQDHLALRSVVVCGRISALVVDRGAAFCTGQPLLDARLLWRAYADMSDAQVGAATNAASLPNGNHPPSGPSAAAHLPTHGHVHKANSPALRAVTAAVGEAGVLLCLTLSTDVHGLYELEAVAVEGRHVVFCVRTGAGGQSTSEDEWLYEMSSTTTADRRPTYAAANRAMGLAAAGDVDGAIEAFEEMSAGERGRLHPLALRTLTSLTSLASLAAACIEGPREGADAFGHSQSSDAPCTLAAVAPA